MPFKLFTKQANLFTIKTSRIAPIAIFQKTVDTILIIEFLITIDCRNVYAQALCDKVRTAAHGQHQDTSNPNVIRTPTNIALKFTKLLYFLY